MSAPAKRTQYEMPFEVELDNSTVECVAVYTVTPGEKETGPTYDCGGTPASPPEVEGVEVFFEHVVRCEEHRFTEGPARCSQCKTVREPRPEWNGLIDEDELLEHADQRRDDRLTGDC